ncbi:MAG TPA: hypothetical protein V6D14_30830 [Coleofasciculaceae cyanobacterium]
MGSASWSPGTTSHNHIRHLNKRSDSAFASAIRPKKFSRCRVVAILLWHIRRILVRIGEIAEGHEATVEGDRWQDGKTRLF